jgi:hypothetical protein
VAEFARRIARAAEAFDKPVIPRRAQRSEVKGTQWFGQRAKAQLQYAFDFLQRCDLSRPLGPLPSNTRYARVLVGDDRVCLFATSKEAPPFQNLSSPASEAQRSEVKETQGAGSA